MRINLREAFCAPAPYELTVGQEGIVLSNESERLDLQYRDMHRFWFRHFGSSAVAFVIEMSGMVYEGNFIKPGDAKELTEQLNRELGDSMDVIFNINQRRGGRFAL